MELLRSSPRPPRRAGFADDGPAANPVAVRCAAPLERVIFADWAWKPAWIPQGPRKGPIPGAVWKLDRNTAVTVADIALSECAEAHRNREERVESFRKRSWKLGAISGVFCEFPKPDAEMVETARFRGGVAKKDALQCTRNEETGKGRATTPPGRVSRSAPADP